MNNTNETVAAAALREKELCLQQAQQAGIDLNRIPAHIAIIMDGNGRWAKERGLNRSLGHQQGVETVREITTTASRLGVKYLTLYTFSTENWNRPSSEVAALMSLILTAMEEELFMKNNVSLRIIGQVERLPENVRTAILNLQERTAVNTGMTMVIALSYSSKWEITEAVRRKPYSVVLLDEIEKAHPDVFNILLQVLDDGRLTDNKGRTVDFRNTIIIMTSNMGSQIIQENFASAFDGKELSPEVVERTRLDVIELLKQQLKPEFLNRIDEIVMFEPLTRRDIEKIVDIQLGIVRRMLEQNGIRLEYTEKARDWIAQAGYDPMYGARPVKRTIQRYIVNDLSKRILAGEVDRGEPIRIDAGPDGLVFGN